MHALALAVVMAAVAVPPSPAHWVEDHAGLISADTRAKLDARLAAYQRATGHQVVVWIGTSLEGAPLDEWANRTFAAWQIGRRGIDDGIALFVFAKDRTIAIEVGYGLEDRVPDAIASRIIRETMAPRLRAGDPDGAITAGVDALLTAIEGAPWSGGSEIEPVTEAPWFTWVIGALALIGFAILAIKHPRLAMMMMGMLLMGRRRGGGLGGGGGFGGGGGRSGGGGARGGW